MSSTRMFTALSLVTILAAAPSCTEEEAATTPARSTATSTVKKSTKPAAKPTPKPVTTAAAGGAWVGISHQPADDEAAKEAGLKKTSGVLVTDVADDGPGARAGVRSGDVIVAANGRTIKDSVSFIRYLKTVHPGDTIDVALWRDGDKKVLPVITAKRSSP